MCVSILLWPRQVYCSPGSCCSGTSVVFCLVAVVVAVRRGKHAPAGAVSEVSLTVSAPPVVYVCTPAQSNTVLITY